MAAFAGVLLALLLAALDQTVVATALPRIAADLHGFKDLSWIVTAYLLTSTATVPLYGKFSDLYGRRTMFVVAIAIFVGGSVLCALAQSMTELTLFRAVQGLGAGGLFPLGADRDRRPLLAARARPLPGLIGSVWALASIGGPLLGGVFTDTSRGAGSSGSTCRSARSRCSSSSRRCTSRSSGATTGSTTSAPRR